MKQHVVFITNRRVQLIKIIVINGSYAFFTPKDASSCFKIWLLFFIFYNNWNEGIYYGQKHIFKNQITIA